MPIKNIAIIPARSGSKRIPKKNIKNFLGKPIIAYAINAAIKSKLFEKVIVSTDDKQIAKIAIQYGAQVPFFRPKEIADDYTGTHEVIGHAVKFLEKNNEKFDYACCIYPTAALIKKTDLIQGYKKIKNRKWEIVFGATNFSYSIFRSFKKLSNGGLKMIFPDKYNSRSQDFPKVYHDAGLFYWAKPKIWKKKPRKFNKKNSIVEIPFYRVQDIDTFEDWKKAEVLYRLFIKYNKSFNEN